jgi:hypothetical protein
MKKFISLILLFATCLFIPIIAFAQGDVAPATGEEVVLPTLPITFDFGQYVSTFLMYAATVVFLTSLVNKGVTKLKGYAKQYMSWVVSMVVAFVAFFFNWGIFEPLNWWQTAMYALITGWGANGLSDWWLIQKILTAVGLGPDVIKQE